MAVYFTRDGKPHCSRCFLSLAGRMSSGSCPSCGVWYAVDRARVAPGRHRIIDLFHRELDHRVDELSTSVHILVNIATRPALRTVSILLVVAGNTVLVTTLGWLALRHWLGH